MNDDLIKAAYGEYFKKVMEHESTLQRLFPRPPRKPLTWRQKLSGRIYRARMAIASKLAGFDVEDRGW